MKLIDPCRLCGKEPRREGRTECQSCADHRKSKRKKRVAGPNQCSSCLKDWVSDRYKTCEVCRQRDRSRMKKYIDSGKCGRCHGPRDDRYLTCSRCRIEGKYRDAEIRKAKAEGTWVPMSQRPKKYHAHMVDESGAWVCHWCHKAIGVSSGHPVCIRCQALTHNKDDLLIEDRDGNVTVHHGRICVWCVNLEREKAMV